MKNRIKELRKAKGLRQEDLADLQQRLFKIEKKDVEQNIAKFAKDEDYDLIIDEAACGFAKSGLNVTDAILKKMGVEKPKK